MSAIVKTDAIILRSMKYRDTSRIVTLYTREFGKLRAIAKGARSSRNKFGSALDPLSRVHVVLYHREHRDLQLISQCDLRAAARIMREDLRRVSTGFACIELLDQVTHDREQQPPLFRLIDEVLGQLEVIPSDPEILLFAFKLRLAEHLGFMPSLGSCIGCGRNALEGREPFWWFDASRGSVACGTCDATRGSRTSAIRISTGSLSILVRLQSGSLAGYESEEPTGAVWNEIRELLRLYLKYHVEHLRPLRAETLLAAANSEQ